MKNIIKKILALVIALTILSCKKEQKKSNPEFKKEVVAKKEVKTIGDYLAYGKKSYAKKINDVLGEHINIETVSIFTEPDTEKVFLVIKLSENLDKEIALKFKIIARTFPIEQEGLREDSVKRNLKFDSWYFYPKQVVVNNEYYVYAQMTDAVDIFDKIILQLINVKEKTISLKKIVITDIEAE